jgi:hypothetical protein
MGEGGKRMLMEIDRKEEGGKGGMLLNRRQFFLYQGYATNTNKLLEILGQRLEWRSGTMTDLFSLKIRIYENPVVEVKDEP